MLDVTNYSLRYNYQCDFSHFGGSTELNINFSENLSNVHKRSISSHFRFIK